MLTIIRLSWVRCFSARLTVGLFDAKIKDKMKNELVGQVGNTYILT